MTNDPRAEGLHGTGDDTSADPLALLPGSMSEARIAHLFRGVRRQGRIHPLQHLIQRYHDAARQADASVAVGAGTAQGKP